MTTNNKIIYFDWAQVEKTSEGNFKVFLEEEETAIIVSLIDVNRIQNRVAEEPELIAIVLAYIEYIFQFTKVPNLKIQQVEQDVIDDNVIVILTQMSAEEMVDTVRNLKWHEIIQVFEAPNKAQKIRDLK